MNSLLADQPLSSKAEQFKTLFESFQTQPPADALPPPGLSLLAGMGSLMVGRGAGPPTFASMLANPLLLASLQQTPQHGASHQQTSVGQQQQQLQVSQQQHHQISLGQQQLSVSQQQFPVSQPQLLISLQPSQELPVSHHQRLFDADGVAAGQLHETDATPAGDRPVNTSRSDSIEVLHNGDSSSLFDPGPAAAPQGVAVMLSSSDLEAAMRAYIDAKFQDLEVRLLDRMAALEQTIVHKIDLLVARL